METLGRFLTIPEQSFFLFGPRGTGKSTWLKQQRPAALYIDLLEPDRYRMLQSHPERLQELLAGSPGASTVIIDEVQRVPELLTIVHRVLESPRRPQFILTGSSARKLRRGGPDLLAGRAVQRSMHPFMAAELPDFSLADALELGLVPLVVGAAQPEETLRAYGHLYIEQEVRAEALTRDVGAFYRFLEALSFSHGAMLNLAAISRECGVERKTVANFLTILEDLLLAFRLPVFRRRAQRATVAHEKFYFFDAGVFRSLRPRGSLDRREEIDGAALEGLVAQHLRAWLAYSGERSKLFYWRTQAGTEIDFVVYGDDGLWAIETKNAARIDRKQLRGLRSFCVD